MDRMVVPLDDTQRRVAKDSELSKVQYRHCRVTDLSQCIELEAASYPVDEAASPEALRYRQKHANKYFLCAVLPGTNGTDQSNLSDDNECNPLDCSIATAKQQDRVIGFVCSTRCDAFTHESMSVHHPHGRLLAIHSVVVDAAFRNLGVATDMLRAYVQHVAKTDVNTNNNNANSTVQLDQKENPTASRPRLHTIVLLSKKHLLPLYINCGFRVM